MMHILIYWMSHCLYIGTVRSHRDWLQCKSSFFVLKCKHAERLNEKCNFLEVLGPHTVLSVSRQSQAMLIEVYDILARANLACYNVLIHIPAHMHALFLTSAPAWKMTKLNTHYQLLPLSFIILLDTVFSLWPFLKVTSLHSLSSPSLLPLQPYMTRATSFVLFKQTWVCAQPSKVVLWLHSRRWTFLRYANVSSEDC